MSFIIRVLILCIVLVSSSVTFAQEPTLDASEAPPVPIFPAMQPTGPFNCFDYYTFGSVQADVQPSYSQTVAGSALSFSGEIKNENPYPLLDGTLYVKIFKQDDSTFAAGDGNQVVDQFVIQENITLSANGSLPINYEWKVPVNAESGEYYAAYFFTTADRYNLLGLSFTDDVVGNKASFNIVANNEVAKLSKIETTLNGQNHHFAAFPHKFNVGDTIIVETSITNPTDQPKTLPLQWNQYAWDAMNQENLRFTKTDIVILAPGETKKVTYEAQPQQESVVYIVAVTQDNEAKSILNIRYVREGIEETRINFPGVLSFPFAKDTENTLFACAHSTNLPVVPGNTLTLSLADKDGNIIHEYRYEGDISGAMAGFGETFTPTKNINYATLTATLERNGVIVEQVTQTYDCAIIDASSCLPEEKSKLSVADFLKTNAFNIVLGLLLLAGIMTILVYRRRKNVHINSNTSMNTPLSLLFLFLLLPTLFFTNGGEVEAKSQQVSLSPTTQSLYYKQNGLNAWAVGLLSGVQVSVTYNAVLKNADTGAVINDGDTLSVGTKITYEAPYNDSDIVWFATGESIDSPNGRWLPHDQIPAVGCESRDVASTNVESIGSCVINARRGARLDVFTPLAMTRMPNNSNLNFQMTGTAGLVRLSQNIWEVTGPGTISATVNFDETRGRFYYRYSASTPTNPGNVCYSGCYLTGQAMTNRSDLMGGAYAYGGLTGPASLPPYDIVVPASAISFNLSVTAPVPVNNPPVTTVTGPTTGFVNTSYSFGVRGDDPEGNTVRVAVDWNMDGVPDTGSPYGNFSPSGTTENFSYSWTTPGTYTFQAQSQDSASMGISPWRTHTVTIAALPPPTANLTINGSDGPINAVRNQTLTLSWSSTNAASCSKWGGSWGSGQAVGISGSETTVVTASGNYMINCGGTTDTVVVNVVNQTPNAPTITHPSGSAPYNTSTTFTISGTDPDGDNVFYEVDWDNNGTVDATTMTVASGASQPANRSWTATGPQTFQARTVDTAGARSGWTSHVINIQLPPAATASIEAQIDGGSWSSANQLVSPLSSVTIRWNSSNATACSASGTGFATGNNTNGTDGVTTPAPTASDTFMVTCSGVGGSGSASLTITSLQSANFTTPLITHNPQGFNPITGTYDALEVIFQTSNNGGINTNASANYQLQFDRGANGYDVTTNGSLGLLNVGASVNRTETVSGVPLGNNRIQVTVDSTNAVVEANEGDNTNTLDIVIPPPNPGLNITADRTQVRSGETVVLSWVVGVPYAMSCRVIGPGIATYSFDPSINGASAGSPLTTGPISAKSEFVLSCTEPITNTTFTDNVIIEAQGEIEEI